MPPNPIVWLTLLVVILAVGVAWTLLTWPRGNPADSLWFWMRLLGYPFLAWAALFGLRLHFHEEEANYLAAKDEVRQADREEAIVFGTEPLAVLGATYLCAMASKGVAGRISQKESVLVARTPKRRMPAIRHTRLASPEDGEGTDRFRQVFQTLLKEIEGRLRAVPSRAPFEVQLQLPHDANLEQLLTAWNTAWDGCGLRSVEAMPVPVREGLMTLDTWLDVYGGPALEKFTLFVAVQLHDTPSENSAEAAVALLLCWAPLEERQDLVPIAMMHRPVACETDGLVDAMTTAALCARATPEELHHLWQSGLSKADKAALLKHASDVRLGAAQADGLPGVHDIDVALGNPGVAGPWFAAALAIEHAQQSHTPQLIACREGALRLAVVRPVEQQSEPETT
ncbi:hypothetical protein [Cupriavidus necator]|uniref:hypothetical protein n=1 Tax=Cupriavidus necator TaxID=106590 RepID=UPI00339D9929